MTTLAKPSIGQQFRVGYHIKDPVLGWDMDLPAFTCAHCNRVMAPGLSRFMTEGASQARVDAAVADWRSHVGVCRKCDMNVCRQCVLLDGECNTIFADAERAYQDQWKQPWLLREGSEPVRRILDKDGEPILVLAKDVGYNDREMERIGGELNYDGSAKSKVGVRP